MKTDKKTMAEIYRHMADNLDNGRNSYDGLQFFNNGQWRNMVNNSFSPEWIYRIKPKTIILSNGVEIPKPLTKEQIGRIPCDIMVYGVWSLGNFYIEENPLDCVHYMNDKSIIYKTKEEAIEASKKLFGIE